MQDAPPFSREEIALLESFVTEILSRETTAQDLPRMAWALRRQQTLLFKAFDVVGEHLQRTQALEAELETLRRQW